MQYFLPDMNFNTDVDKQNYSGQQLFLYEPVHVKTNNLGFRPGLTQTSLKIARSLKFQMKEEGLYYPCSENKGADQLRHSYREGDLRLCFRICRLLVFPCGGSY